MNLDSYEFMGDELLDRFDRVRAANERARFHLELYNERRREHEQDIPPEMLESGFELRHAKKELQDAHKEMDELFRREYSKFPIETVEVDGNGNRNCCVTVIETEATSYGEMVEALQEINGDLSDGEPGMDYSNAPSPIAAVDYSDELISEYRKLETTQEMLNETLPE